jgi:hypothetical protein
MSEPITVVTDLPETTTKKKGFPTKTFVTFAAATAVAAIVAGFVVKKLDNLEEVEDGWTEVVADDPEPVTPSE